MEASIKDLSTFLSEAEFKAIYNLFDDMPDMHAELAIDPSKVGTAAYEPTIRQRIDLYSKAQAGGWASQSQLLRLYEQPENQVPATLESKHE